MAGPLLWLMALPSRPALESIRVPDSEIGNIKDCKTVPPSPAPSEAAMRFSMPPLAAKV
ncbi:hypothetical protein CC79DRAFT_1331123 [Sarocladium strictum]